MTKDKNIVGNTARKIENFYYYKKQQDSDMGFYENYCAFGMEYLEETKRLAKEEAKMEVLANADDIVKEYIKELKKDNMILELKLHDSLPLNMILLSYIIVAAFSASLATFIIQIVLNVKIIDFYILIFLLITTLGLLCTSVYTIICWKRYISALDESKKR